jgi:predicted PurR-regulated permease PerM
VFLIFATAVAVIALALGSVVVDQSRSAAKRVDAYVTVSHAGGKTGAEQDIDRLQHWLDTHGLERIQIQKQATKWVDNLGAGEISTYTQDAFTFAQGAATSIVVALFNLVLIIVIAVYMLLDMERLERVVDRRFPPGDGLPLTLRIEKALAGYVRGQLILSTVIGLSAGIGMWILGHTGLVPGADRYALLFGVWTAVIEVIPYIGPWLSAIPPAIYALVVDPISVLWVLALFVFIYQVEGHVVVPNVMANALRLHPLLVIFGLLAGGELYGIAGVLLALPTMAAGRAMWEFFSERIRLDPWDANGIPADLDVGESHGSPADIPLTR